MSVEVEVVPTTARVGYVWVHVGQREGHVATPVDELLVK